MIFIISECGGIAPIVTLTCANKAAHVHWFEPEPGCLITGCEATWSCDNGSDTYDYEVGSCTHAHIVLNKKYDCMDCKKLTILTQQMQSVHCIA